MTIIFIGGQLCTLAQVCPGGIGEASRNATLAAAFASSPYLEEQFNYVNDIWSAKAEFLC